MSDVPHYSIVIEWSEDDGKYVVILPEWADRSVKPIAAGATFEEAVERGKNALENYLQFSQEDGIPLPPPCTFAA